MNPPNSSNTNLRNPGIKLIFIHHSNPGKKVFLTFYYWEHEIWRKIKKKNIIHKKTSIIDIKLY